MDVGALQAMYIERKLDFCIDIFDTNDLLIAIDNMITLHRKDFMIFRDLEHSYWTTELHHQHHHQQQQQQGLYGLKEDIALIQVN